MSEGPNLSPVHRELLAASAISDEVVAERSYFTGTTKAALGRLGFGRSQQSAPALVIPQWNVLGEPVGYLSRPDEPANRPERRALRRRRQELMPTPPPRSQLT